MKLAVLPFNALEGTKPALGRQFSAFVAEQLRAVVGAEVNTVQMLTQVPDEDGTQRIAFVNIADALLDVKQVRELFEQPEIDIITDGSLLQNEDAFEMVLRAHRRDGDEPEIWTRSFTTADVFNELHWLLKKMAELAEATLPEELAGETMLFGTEQPATFLKFLEGFDALSYINQANGLVAREFSPEPGIQTLLEAIEADADFEGPYQVLVQLCRACVNFRIGSFELIEPTLTKLTELIPDDFPAYFALGELYEAVNQHQRAGDFYERATQIQPNDPGLWTRLGISQLRSGMPVNAERNFRRALELEGDDKPTTGFLADVLTQTGRAHEVPGLWKEIVDKQPENGFARARYAVSLINADKNEEGEKAFEDALESIEDNTLIKRFYAPYLTSKGDLDRAMDFYEDCIDVAPADVELLQEYAQTLQQAGRTFEIPAVLRNILAANPNPNVRAETQAWLVELDQPKRAESVENARKKMEEGDFEGALRDLKPLRNWLADYWKMWALLASAHNQLRQFKDAEEASRRLIDVFPGCEPAYGELVNALSNQGKADEAYQIMRYVLSQNPNSIGLAINLAIAAQKAGHADEAKALARQIREAVGTQNADLNVVLDELEA